MPVAKGRNRAKNPSTIMTTAHPMDIPVILLNASVVLRAVKFFSPCLIVCEMEAHRSSVLILFSFASPVWFLARLS